MSNILHLTKYIMIMLITIAIFTAVQNALQIILLSLCLYVNGMEIQGLSVNALDAVISPID